jgi:uncharacterized protein
MERAREFLAAKRIAFVGVTREKRGFSVAVFEDLARRGIDVVPVNPAAGEIQGRRCFARVQDVDPPVDAALIMTASAMTATVVRDCIAAGVTRIWLHRGTGAGSASAEALEVCRAHGIAPIMDLCPFMALPDASWFHRVHAYFRQRA